MQALFPTQSDEQANILAEEARVFEQNLDERARAARERVRKASERLEKLLGRKRNPGSASIVPGYGTAQPRFCLEAFPDPEQARVHRGGCGDVSVGASATRGSTDLLTTPGSAPYPVPFFAV